MNSGERAVTADEADIRLDRWLRRHIPGLTQGTLERLCRTGQVRVDGRRVQAATRLSAGQSVRVPAIPTLSARPERHAAVPDPAMLRELKGRVLYQDDQLMVLNKPPDLPVQGGPGITRHLDAMLDGLRLGGDRPRLVHRLDRDTSGVLLLARTPGTAAKLAAAFRRREVEKVYWAVVARAPIPSEGRLDLPLRRLDGARGERTGVAETDDPGAAHAITEYRTLDHAGRKLAWLELRPLTGRTHQLRVHCVALGAPILGDLTYAQPDQNGAFAATVRGLSDRLHLHARALALPHPAGGVLRIEAELPDHMRDTFRTLGFRAPATQPPHRSAR
jgi:23S rRNA pseudouridine955/2504/2580 synthase